MSELINSYPNKLYFVTLTEEGWVNVLDRNIYKDELVKNLKHCQQKEGLQIYAYVIMGNHLHKVAAREEGDLGELLGRFKSYTAKRPLNMTEANPQESRKEWMLNLFKHFAAKNNPYSNSHFWNYTNHPVELWGNEVILQKIEYIHNNPVRAGIVTEAHYYLYSSACFDSPLKVLAF